MQFSTWLFNSLVLKSFHAHALADSQFQMWWILFSFLLNNSAQSNQIHIVRLVDLYRSFSIQSHFDVRLYPLEITRLLNLFFCNVFARKKEEEDHSFFIHYVTITIIFIVMPRYFSSFLVFICFLQCRNNFTFLFEFVLQYQSNTTTTIERKFS